MAIEQIKPAKDWVKTLNDDLEGLKLTSYDNYPVVGTNGWKVTGNIWSIDVPYLGEKGRRLWGITLSITSQTVKNDNGVDQEFSVGKVTPAFTAWKMFAGVDWSDGHIWGVRFDGDGNIQLHSMGSAIDAGHEIQVNAVYAVDI